MNYFTEDFNWPIEVKFTIVVLAYDKFHRCFLRASKTGHDRHIDVVYDGIVVDFLCILCRPFLDIILLFNLNP